MRSGIFSALFLAFLTGAAVTTPALAQRYDRDGVQPLDRLLPEIRRQHPGDFYDAEGPTYGPNGDPHYHLKWMTPDGRVIWYDADARSGRVLRSSPGRDGFDGGGRGRFRGPDTGYQNFSRPGARDPYEDRYRGRFGGSFDSRRDYDRGGFDRGGRRGFESHGPRWNGPRAGDFGRRDGGGRGRHR
jgi:hypothetical protein